MTNEHAWKCGDIILKEIEPKTPRISLGGRSPAPTPTYEEHCHQLQQEGVPSVLEIREVNRNNPREILIEEVSEEDL